MGLNIKMHGKSIQLTLEQDGVNLSVIYRWSLSVVPPHQRASHPWTVWSYSVTFGKDPSVSGPTQFKVNCLNVYGYPGAALAENKTPIKTVVGH